MLTSFGTERTLMIFSFAGPGKIKQAHSNLPKINQKESWHSPKLKDLSEDFYVSGRTNSINGITVKTEKEVSHH